MTPQSPTMAVLAARNSGNRRSHRRRACYLYGDCVRFVASQAMVRFTSYLQADEKEVRKQVAVGTYFEDDGYESAPHGEAPSAETRVLSRSSGRRH